MKRILGGLGISIVLSSSVLPRVCAGVGLPAAQRNALISLYNATSGDNWDDNTDWLGPSGSECGWHGVTCGAGGVTELHLAGNGLAGELPAAMGDLTQLRFITLSGNQLTGPIPAELGSLGFLESLFLTNNELSGQIPAELGNLSRLEELLLTSNNLEGPIPEELGNLTNLTDLTLNGNHLTGPIPDSLANLIQLDRLYLSSNELTGPIPAFLGNLSELEELYLSGNSLTGPIPAGLGLLSKLERLLLGANELDGAIPPELGNLTVLQDLWLGDNNLTGSIPEALCNLTNLEELRLDRNELSGPIPPCLGDLTGLQILYLERNELSGPIPKELEMLVNLAEGGLNLRQNRLYTEDPALRDFLNSKQIGGDWETFQTLSDLLFAQLGNGLGLISRLVFTSSDPDSEALVYVVARDDTGALLELTLNGEAFSGEGEFVLPPLGRLDLASDGQGALVSGSVTVTANRVMDGVLLFSGEGLGFAGVGSSRVLESGFSTPVEFPASGLASPAGAMAGSVSTGAAIQNLEEEEVELSFRLLDPEGNVAATSDGTRADDGPFAGSLSGLGHVALFADQLEWETELDLTGFVGILQVEASGSVAATAILTRPGQFATLPVTPLPE